MISYQLIIAVLIVRMGGMGTEPRNHQKSLRKATFESLPSTVVRHLREHKTRREALKQKEEIRGRGAQFENFHNFDKTKFCDTTSRPCSVQIFAYKVSMGLSIGMLQTKLQPLHYDGSLSKSNRSDLKISQPADAR